LTTATPAIPATLPTVTDLTNPPPDISDKSRARETAEVDRAIHQLAPVTSEVPGAPSTTPAPSAWRRPWAAVALGAGSSLAGLLLTGAAAWLLVRAVTMPPVLTLSAAVVLVRGSAVARPLLRYLERLLAHDVAFARLGARRALVYAALIPRVPGPRLRRRGDLLSRVVDDVDARVDGLLRGRLPALSTAATVTVAIAVAVGIAPAAALPLLAGLVVAGLIAPAVAARQAVREDTATAAARSRLRDAMVETVAGIEELPGIEVPEQRSRILANLESRAAHAAGRAAALAHLGWGIAVAGTASVLPHTTGPAPEWSAVVLLAVVALGEPMLALPDAAVARRRAAGAARRLAALTNEPPSVTFPVAAEPPATVRNTTDHPARDNIAGPNQPAETPRPTTTNTTDNPTRHHNTRPNQPAETPRPTTTNTTGHPARGQNAGPDRLAGTPRPAGPSMTDRPARLAGAAPPAGLGDISVRGLTAGWEARRAPALRDLDLDLPSGSRVAVVGRSGSGKSTLGAVLARLLDPRAGAITAGRRDLRTLPEPALRGRIVLVGDDTDHIFASTVRENLRLARPAATDRDLHAVLSRVCLDGWLATLPDGLDTWLGTGGSTMSGGQSRRLATARALLADPEVLILDEPTEGLDAETAEALMADLLDAAAGRTVLLLTHRTEGLDRVDRVLTLVHGRFAAEHRPTDGLGSSTSRPDGPDLKP
jgi:ATP-binding cassette subfamily C protein CydCD